jgi:hypothetical protein
MTFLIYSVIVDDFNIASTGIPSEAHSPLSIDPNAVLANPVAGECFEAVARQCAQALQRIGGIKYAQSFFRLAFEPGISRNPLAVEQALGFLAFETFYHVELSRK